MEKIWLNAFACVRPSDEFAAAVGRDVIKMLMDNPGELREGELVKPFRRVQIELICS